MVYIIIALIIICGFILHISIIIIKKIERDNSYNQNIKVNVGYPVYDNRTANNAGLMYEVDENSETIAIIEPMAHVTSSFANVTIRLFDVVTGYFVDFVLDHQVIIGRKSTREDIDIQFDDSRISAKHCCIYRQGEQFYVRRCSTYYIWRCN